MKKYLVFMVCFLFIFSVVIFQGCGNNNDSPQLKYYTITTPADTDDYMFNLVATSVSDRSSDEDSVKIKVLENSEVKLIIAFNSLYVQQYDLSNFAVFLDGHQVQTVPQEFEGLGKVGFEILIETKLSKDHTVTVDASGISLNTVSASVVFEFDPMQLAVRDDIHSTGKTSVNLMDDPTVIANWNIKYKLASATEWITLTLLDVITHTNTTLSQTVTMPVVGDEKIMLKVRYGEKHIFSMSNNAVKWGSENVGRCDNNIYDDEGYATYELGRHMINAQSKLNVKFTSPNSRQTFTATNENQQRLFIMVKESFDEDYIRNTSIIQNSRLDFGVGTQKARFFIGETFSFKMIPSYIDNLFFDEWCDFSDAKVLCASEEIEKDDANVYNCTFSTEMLENGEFAFNTSGVVAREGYKKVAYPLFKAYEGEIPTLQVEAEKRLYPMIEQDIFVMPASLTIVVYDNAERYPGPHNQSPAYVNQSLEIKINGEVVKTVTSSDLQYNGESYRNFTYTIDFSSYENMTDKDYIQVEFNEI